VLVATTVRSDRTSSQTAAVSPVVVELEVELVVPVGRVVPPDAVGEPPPHPELRTASDPRVTRHSIKDALLRPRGPDRVAVTTALTLQQLTVVLSRHSSTSS
jgi:hypothetical protein